MATTPKEIVIAVKNGLASKLNLSSSQVSACIARFSPKTSGFKDTPYFVIVPGQIQTEGGGQGGQWGGEFYRTMFVHVIIYDKAKKDMVGKSEIVLEETPSILDWTESVINTLHQTYLGQNPYSPAFGLLIEPMFYLNESSIEWVDEDQGLISKEISFSATFEVPDPQTQTLLVPTNQSVNA